MNSDHRPGRHRAPGSYSPLGELKTIARASAQPAIRGAAVVAAAGGLVATLAAPASAETTAGDAAVADAPIRAPRAAPTLGPDATTSPAPAVSTALSSIGYVGSAAFSGTLSKIISDYRRTNPDIELHLHEFDISQQVEDVYSGRIDVGYQLNRLEGLRIDGQPEKHRWRINFGMGEAF